ncbi:hypothetical protein KP509_24G035700 [Ceratopteris richardii]|nr:hypothetical protein KP509_24G035700 [Ceratopteris richardii]
MLAMEVFIEKHMVETAVEMFQSILKLHTRPDEDAYHLILQVLLESGRTDVAMEIYEQMKKDRWCNPVSSTFLLMLWGLGKTAKIGEAQKLLEDLKSKNEISISEAHCQLVRGLCEGPWMDYAVQAIIEMYELGFEPDENVHISFVHGYIRAGRLMEAFNYYKDAVSSNLIAPKMDVLTLLLSSFCAQKNPEIAQEVLMAMVETGLCPDPHIYVSVIQCVLEQGQGQLNPWLSGALRKQGVDKDVKFFSSIIILCTDAGDVEAALSVFCQMVTYHSICPEKAAFSALVFKMFEYNQANFWQKLFSAIEGSEMSLQTTIFQMVSDILANVDEKVANHVLSLMKDTCLSKLTIRPK